MSISLRSFDIDIDRKFQFFGDIPITLRILYTKSSYCKRIPGDVRNIRRLRNLLMVCVCPGPSPFAKGNKLKNVDSHKLMDIMWDDTV